MDSNKDEKMVLISEENVKNIIQYFEITNDESFTWAVNYLVDIAVEELKAIDEKVENEQKELRKLLNEMDVFLNDAKGE